MEVCKREGSDPEEKGVDRLLGLGSSRCGAGVLLRGGVSENARVQLLGTQPCQLPRWKVVTRNGGLGRAGGGRVSLWGLSHPCPRSGSAGRVVLSREDKEAAKLGLSVFTVIAPKCLRISWRDLGFSFY